MRRRLTQCTIWCVWILCALLVFASLDAIPDPPAVNPHMVKGKLAGPGELAETLSGQSANSVSPLTKFQTQGPVFFGDIDPDCLTIIVAKTGQAADPSPPRVPMVLVDLIQS